MSSSGPQRWRSLRLPLGCRTKAGAPRKGGARMIAATVPQMKSPDHASLGMIAAARAEAMNWSAIANGLNEYGSALRGGALPVEECNESASLYAADDRFRSRVVMGRHGFGRGEYKYFSYPLPDLIATMRPALYARLCGVANRWNQSMGIDIRYPDAH